MNHNIAEPDKYPIRYSAGQAYVPFQYYWENDHALFIEPLAAAYYRSGNLGKSVEEYERLVSLTAGRLFFGDIYAKSFYMLGKIAEQQGQKAKAIEHYQKFLALWKDADPGQPEVEDARKRLAGLKGGRLTRKRSLILGHSCTSSGGFRIAG